MASRTPSSRPLLAPWWRAVEDRGRLLFEHAGQVVELNGRAVGALLPTLVPLLDGTHTVREIVEVLGEAAEAPIAKALTLLEEHGLLVDGPAAAGHDTAACYVAAVSSATPAQARNCVDELVRRGGRIGAAQEPRWRTCWRPLVAATRVVGPVDWTRRGRGPDRRGARSRGDWNSSEV